jgi:hypothetical protein
MAMALTIVLMPKFIGAKPSVIANGTEPGVGKTMAMQVLAVLQNGKQVPTITYNERDEELEKRLGSVVKSGVQTLIIDNAKTSSGRRGRERGLQYRVGAPVHRLLWPRART